MAAKLTNEAAGTIAAVQAMDEVVSEAVMFVRLLDFLIADAFSDHKDGFYRVHEGTGELISFVSARTMHAIRACDEKVTSLDPRPPMGGVK